MNHTEIENIDQFNKLIQNQTKLDHYAFQDIDFASNTEAFNKTSFVNCLFLGCNIPNDQVARLWNKNSIFPKLDLPFNPYPSGLYNASKLYSNYELGHPESYKNTYDYKVYQHFVLHGKEDTPINISLAQRLHDHAITDSLYDLLSRYDEKKVVAIMGGHNIQRSSQEYSKVANLSKILSEKSYLMVSGGGPGSMEATHLGAWFAGRPQTQLEDAIKLLSKAPNYRHKLWLDAAIEVMHEYPRTNHFESLGVPTWFYGHEPATPFATQIAKYFANSVREDGLLAIAKGGIIFTPGSAGTIQEIFQDANQNHYQAFGYPSPMIFLGKDYWGHEMPVYPFLQNLVEKGKYQNLILSVHDEFTEIYKELALFSQAPGEQNG